VIADPPDATLAGTDDLLCRRGGGWALSGVLCRSGGGSRASPAASTTRAANGAPLVGGRFVARPLREGTPFDETVSGSHGGSGRHRCAFGRRTSRCRRRKLVAQKFDGSQQRRAPGRPAIDQEVEALVVRMAQENRLWGDDRMVGALANLGYTVSDQTVGNILKRHSMAPAPERKITTTWKEFIRTHMDVLMATDFCTTEVRTLGGLVTYYVLFFVHLGSRKVHIAGVTPHPNQAWMMQIARNVTMEQWGFLPPGQYLMHDRDGTYGPAFQQIIDAAGVTRVPGPSRSPNLNAYAERWVRSVQEECLSRLILYGEASLRHALTPYVEHVHHERNHQRPGQCAALSYGQPRPSA
jgi:transposase InsO family protein